MTLRDYYVAHAPAAEIAELVPTDDAACAAFVGITVQKFRANRIRHRLVALAKARAMWADAMCEVRPQWK